LNCCAYTAAADEKIEAFLIAVSTFLMLEKYTQPDHVTFATFLKAVSKLIPRGEERRKQVVDVVRSCSGNTVSFDLLHFSQILIKYIFSSSSCGIAAAMGSLRLSFCNN